MRQNRLQQVRGAGDEDDKDKDKGKDKMPSSLGTLFD